MHARLFSTLFLLAACYEGWDDSPVEVDSNITEGPKTFAYILYQPIVPSHDTIVAGGCAVDQDTRLSTEQEWGDRIGATVSALGKIAEKVVTVPIPFESNDCPTMDKLLAAATSEIPWEDEAAPQSDSQNRPSLHLKAIYWDEDVPTTTNPKVAAVDWRAVTLLKAEGRRINSLSYFVMPAGNSAYFGGWFNSISGASPASAKRGTYLDPKDSATESGLASRKDVIERDIREMIAWILENGTT